MIKINLLPPGMRTAQLAQAAAKTAAAAKSAATAVAAKTISAGLGITATRILLFGVVGVVSLVVLAFVGAVVVPCWLAHSMVTKAHNRWNPLEREFTRLDALNTQGATDGTILDELSAQIVGRLRWARILNAVSDVIPSSVQLVSLGTVASKEMVPSVPVLDPAAKKPAAPADKKAAPAPMPPMVEGTVQVLNLEGIVAKGKLGEDDIKILLDQIRSHAVFKEYFDSANLTDVASMPDQTKKFSIRCKFKMPEKTA